MHATGTFEVKMDTPPAGAKPEPIGRMGIDKKFHGDLEGSSRVEMLTGMSSVPGSGVYVAIEHVIGTLSGRSGSFMLHHTGISERNQQTLTVRVIPDSGTGGLTGLSGSMQIRIEEGKHFYDLEYQLPQS